MRTPPQKRKQQTEVQAARGRLRGVLNESLNQDQDVDDISEDYEEEEEEEEELPTQPVAPTRPRGRPRKIPIAQPVKAQSPPPAGLITPNKRRKRDFPNAIVGTSGQNNKIQAESFVMKLFDRTLDLSKYTEQTPLYPICRAWMANQPRNPSIRSYRETRSPSPVHRKDNAVELLTQLRKGTLEEVIRLPKPKGTNLPKLAPQQQPRKYTSNDELIQTGDTGIPEKEILMAQHLCKWKRIKTDWQKHTKRFQQRNDLNFLILQELFKP